MGRTAQNFGDTFHLSQEMTSRIIDGKSVATLEFRAWYEKHPDAMLPKLLWPAKLSTPLAMQADLHKRFPGGYVPLTADGKSIADYLEWKYAERRATENQNSTSSTKG